MQLMRHLNDEELTDVLLESDDRDLQPLLRGLPGALRSSTDLPEWFWLGQRAAIRRRIAAPPRAWARPLLRWSVVVALFLVALMLLQSGPKPTQSQLRPDPDQELLVAVEDVVQSAGPSSLEPAALLAEEISGSVEPASRNNSRRESR